MNCHFDIPIYFCALLFHQSVLQNAKINFVSKHVNSKITYKFKKKKNPNQIVHNKYHNTGGKIFICIL